LLGPAALSAEQSGSVRISSQKCVALLAYLAMHCGRPVGRAVLADLLWGDRVEAQARQSLRQAILTLRRDLGAACSSLISIDDQALMLTLAPEDVDALQFASWAVSPHPVDRERCLDAPWAPFLENFSVGAEPFDEWVAAERHRLDALATRVFSDLAKQFDAAGNGERAILALERLIAIDPVEEERHRRLLALEARYRGPDAALARAKEMAARLKREVDAEPEPATRALVEEIRTSARRQPDLAHHAPTAALAATAVRPARTDDSPVRVAPKPPVYRDRHIIAAAGLTLLLLVGGAIVSFLHSDAWLVPSQRPGHERVAMEPAPADLDWQSPSLPSQRADDVVAPGRGVVAIGVLPFTSHAEAGDAPGVVADMMTDDLTYLLSRAPVFRVISRQTMMSYRGQTIDARALGSELGVHYLLEGNVSPRGDVLRVTVGLIDTRTRLHVWSGSFERTGSDRHTLQTEIVNSLGRELHYSVAAVEGLRASSSPDVNELIFKGFAAISDSRHRGAEGLRPAEGYFEQAIERDPGALRASIGLGLFHTHMALQMFAPDPAPHLARAEDILQPIIERHPGFSEAYAGIGLGHVARGKMRDAIAAFERAIALNPSDAPSYAQIGRALVRIGQPHEGLAHINYAMKLSPRDPVIGYWIGFAGYAELELGNYERAIEHLNRSHALNPTQPRTLQVLIAANALAGNLSVARQQLALLQMHHPHLKPDRLRKIYGHNSRAGTRFQEGMLRALADTASAAPAAQPRAAAQQRSDNPTRSNVGRGVTSVVVLPFTAHAQAGGSAHIVADILTDDLTVQLSRIPGLLVTARQSAAAYKGKPIDAARIASELNVRYLLEGSVRTQGQGLRVNLSLIDAANGLQIWNTRFVHAEIDGDAGHDAITARLARELQVQIYDAESVRRRDDPANGLVFKGWTHIARVHHAGDDLEKARAAFAEVLARMPRHPRALTGMAAYHVHAAQLSLLDYEKHFGAAKALLQTVIAAGHPSATTYSLLGQIHKHRKQTDQALHQFERALAIDPDNAAVHAQVGHTMLLAGRLDEGLARIHHAMRLSPNDPRMPTWLNFAAEGELERGNVPAAIALLDRAKPHAPRNLRILGNLASAHALAGSADRAREAMAEFKQAAPYLSDAKLLEKFGGNNPHRARISRGMQEALAVTQLRGSANAATPAANVSQHH
jgi:TolB-like protein/DNA-binding SARP family transcriptional activator